jgi:hypothetical protein
MNAVRAFFNMVLNADGLPRLRAGKSRNMSHGCPSEVKKMLKEFGDDPFGNEKSFWVTMDDGGRSSATPVQ